MKRILSFLISFAVILGTMAGPAAGTVLMAAAVEQENTNTSGRSLDDIETEFPVCENHEFSDEWVPAKIPTYTGIGWAPYQVCLNCPYSTRVEIPMLPVPDIMDYDTFLKYLGIFEELAGEYIMKNPGKDSLNLIIKYIRTGVERYNSGSWGIMAGYEDAAFAKYAAEMEDMINSQMSSEAEMLAICSLKNLANFYLPNGDLADLGHMFGTMDITYHNKYGSNHADVAGWAGDLVDLLEFADKNGVNGTLEEMIQDISQNYLGKTPTEIGQSGFSYTDIIGDLDAYYIMQQLQKLEYTPGALTALISGYFTPELTLENRADFFLRNRLDGASTRSEIREAVYSAYINNKVVATLEGTREFSSPNLEDLKKACCYAFADFLCVLAGDYVENADRSYFTVFSAEKSTLAPGVKQEIKYATTADGEQTKFYLATADITRDDVHVYANYKDNDPTKGWGLQRVLDQANAAQKKYGDPGSPYYIPNYSVIASINGAGFNMSTGQPGGLLVMGGVEYSPIDNGGFFGILDDGTAVIGTTNEYNTVYKGRVQEGIAGFGSVLIKNGKIVVAHSDNYTNDRASRTAVGITRTGKVVFMVMDGRQKGAGACGGSMQEIAQVLLEAGCVHAINLDGGGSTTYVGKPEGKDELEVVSSPSDGVQRSVSASLMIVSTAPDSTAFDHALVDSEFDYMTAGATQQMTAAGVSATGDPAEIPEGAYWQVSDESWATITADGVLTAVRGYGFAVVNLVCNGNVIGSKEIGLCNPDNLYFTKENINAVYGEQVVLPIKALYSHKEVAITPNDVIFSLDNGEAGTVNGFVFTASSGTNVKVVRITACLASSQDTTASMKISLYNQGEISFDFEQATGGNRQLAWDRQVTNSTTDDKLVYTVVDSSEPMVTSYTLALDMSQIPIPQKLADLTVMLPGSDMADATAWKFLCNLAERISSLTTVSATVQFDPNVVVDYSGLQLINDYFTLENDEVTLDEATNTLSMILHWKKVYNPIDVTTANPLCIVNGIRLTPKDGADWSAQNRLNIVNSGEIGYKIYLRASSLVTFAQKPENQATFGLYDYSNPDDAKDAGAYFEDTYAKFDDSYTLVNSVKSGWILGDRGYSYFRDGVMLTGMQKIGELYYDLGADGVNRGRTPYTGIFEMGGGRYYSRDGKLLTNGWYTIGDKEYHSHADSTIHEATVVSTKTSCVKSYSITKTCTTDPSHVEKSVGIYPKGHDWSLDYVCKICGTVGTDVTKLSKGFGTISKPSGSSFYYNVGGILRPSFFVTADGVNKLTYSNDNNLTDNGTTMRDLFISWENDRGIGKAVMNIIGRGDYYGETRLDYTILPNDVKNLRVSAATSNSITLTWDKAAGAGYYRLYQVEAGGSRKAIDEHIIGTSYTVVGLKANTEYKFIMACSAVSTDGEEKVYNSPRWSNELTAKSANTALIPSMYITSDNPSQGRAFVDASKSNEATAQMTLTGANGEVLYNGALTQIKARGNSTFAHYAKKSYQIKLGVSSDLIGQNENVKTWVLLANYGDATLMHDKFFKDLASQMGMPYVAGSNWVNLWYDGEYRGVYLLSEKNSVGSTSVDITDLEDAYEASNPSYGTAMQTAIGVNKYGQSYAYTLGLTEPANITGGYLIELNHSAWDEVNGFKTAKGKGFNVKSPEWAGNAAMQYISEYYQEFENAVYATDANGKYTGYNTATGKYFYDYVDMDSLVKIFLLQEFGVNPDGFVSSLYFYKDVNGKMYAGPIWDQDMTLGTGWTKYLASNEKYAYHYLAEALIQIPAFKARVEAYFAAEFAPMIRAALAAGGSIDQNYALLAESAEWNYQLWPYVLVGDPANANHIWANADYASVVAEMKAWMSSRLALLESIYAVQYEPGDANHDGKADSSDAVAILRKLAGYVVENFHADTADFNGDGKADSSDAVAILRKLAGY